MLQFTPFRALRPPPEKAARVASVPYDVVSTAEAGALAAGNELSLLHVSRPEIDLPQGTDLYADEVYAKGRENLDRLIRDCPLLTDKRDCFYVYRQRMGEHVQTGVVGCCAVDDLDNGLIKRHERTRKDKEDDRTRHIVTLRAQTGPVFLTHRPVETIDRLVARLTADSPLYDFVAPDGIGHTMWRIEDAAAVESAFKGLRWCYIADGHHRAAGASRARTELHRQRSSDGARAVFPPGASPRFEPDWFLAVLFPANQLRILPYHRVVKHLGGLDLEPFLRKAEESLGAKIVPWHGGAGEDSQPRERGVCRMYLSGRWYTVPLLASDESKRSATAALDVSILTDRLLSPILDIHDLRTDKRIDFVGGIRGTRELVRLVDGGEAMAAFAMHPTTVEELMTVADAGEMMPPKSTWFEPKLRSGLVIHRI